LLVAATETEVGRKTPQSFWSHRVDSVQEHNQTHDFIVFISSSALSLAAVKCSTHGFSRLRKRRQVAQRVITAVMTIATAATQVLALVLALPLAFGLVRSQ
jgi:type IV secretory pathway component VirB8